MPSSMSVFRRCIRVRVLRIFTEAVHQPREVHLGWREDAPEGVVKLTRERSLLALGVLLQEVRE